MLAVQCMSGSKPIFYSNGSVDQMTNGTLCDSLTAVTPVTVPSGWRRDVVDGRIVYISRTNCLLWSYQEVAAYLQTNGTCKCGLECPVIVTRTFNFDPSVPSALKATGFSAGGDQSPSPQGNLCNHKRKMDAMAAYQESLVDVQQQHQHQSINMNQHGHFIQHQHHHGLSEETHIIRTNAFHHGDPEKQHQLHEVTAVTPAITEVIPSVGHHHHHHQLLGHNASHGHHMAGQSAATQVVQLLNPSFQFASGAITVLQQAPTQQQPEMHHHGHAGSIPLILGHAGAQFAGHDQMLLSPQLPAAFTQIPMQAQPQYLSHSPHQAHHAAYATHAHAPQHHVHHHQQPTPGLVQNYINMSKKRSRRRKDYRSNRHPPTVAAILREAEEAERKRLKVEAEERLRDEQQQLEISEGISEHVEEGSITTCDQTTTSNEMATQVSGDETEEDAEATVYRTLDEDTEEGDFAETEEEEASAEVALGV